MKVDDWMIWKKAAEDFKSFTRDQMVFSLDECKNY